MKPVVKHPCNQCPTPEEWDQNKSGMSCLWFRPHSIRGFSGKWGEACSSPPLQASDFSSINRTDGAKQTNYRGWPLYYFQNDKKPGDVKGENVLQTWYVARPDYTMMIASRLKTESYLTDGTGRALYIWAKDTIPGVSSCTGSCIATWPAFWVDNLVVPSVLDPANFSTIIRGDGSKQWAYMGRPLYYYSADKDAGDLYGDGIGNVWFAANVTGILPVPATPATTATTPSPFPLTTIYGFAITMEGKERL